MTDNGWTALAVCGIGAAAAPLGQGRGWFPHAAVCTTGSGLCAFRDLNAAFRKANAETKDRRFHRALPSREVAVSLTRFTPHRKVPEWSLAERSGQAGRPPSLP